jgi:uncharacterized protein YjdB
MKLILLLLLCGLCPAVSFAQSDGLPRGAYDVPYTRYESEDATRGGGAVLRSSPAFVQTDVASEASNQKYVGLPTTGSSVSWTMSKPGAGVDLRFTLPDASNGNGVTGALNLYVNGSLVKTISLSSYWSWQYFANGSGDPANIPGGRAFMRFDEVHFKLASRLNAGDVVKIQKDNGDSYEYGVDFIEVEEVPAALAKPSGYLSVTDYGAVPNDGADDMTAFNNCLAAAKSAGTGMYIPEGTFTLATTWRPTGTLVGIKGAGMWYSNLNFSTNAYYSGGIMAQLSGTEISGLYLSTANNVRQANGQARVYKCFMGTYGTGSKIHDIWEEHFECGFWIGGYDNPPVPITSNLLVSHNRIRNNYADGCNLAQGTNNSTVEFNSVRNNGDDGLASWSSTDAGVTTVCTNLEFKNNTIENNWRAGGIGIFGGANHKIHHNTVKDGIGGSGIRFTTEFPGNYFDTNTNMQVYEMTITNCGTSTDLYNQERGAIDMYAANAPIKNITFNYVDIVNAQRHGVQFGPNTIDNITYNSLSINGTGRDNETKAVFTAPCGGYAIMTFAGTGTSTFNNLSLANIEMSPPTYKTQQAYNLIINTTTAPVAVTGVSMSPTSASLSVNGTVQLTATVAPSTATNKNVSWTTSNANVATVSISGLVKGVGSGTATITATTQDGSKTATSAITIAASTAPGTLTANKTASTITVNGQLTETAWQLNQSVGKTTVGSPNNTVTFGVLWDNTNLYIGAKIVDANLFADSPDVWNDDAIEVYIDANNNKLASYDGQDNQIIKNFNKSTVYTKLGITGLQHAWSAISGGYSVELAIPWSQLGISAPAAGTTIGFDLGYDDDDNGGDRDGQAVWNGTVNNYASTAGFGSLTLSNSTARTLATSAAALPDEGLTYGPSPVAKELHISSDGSYSQVEVLDMLGKVQYRDAAIAGKKALALDLSRLASGVYFVKVHGEQGTSGFRIIKE